MSQERLQEGEENSEQIEIVPSGIDTLKSQLRQARQRVHDNGLDTRKSTQSQTRVRVESRQRALQVMQEI